MPCMFTNNGVEIGCKGKSTFEYEESSSTYITSGMGSLNLTPHLVNPLMNLLLVSKAWMLFVVNPNLNMGNQH